MPVRTFYDLQAQKDIPLSSFHGPLYAAFWIDANGNRIIDGSEIVKVVLEFK
jgi:hypothetical protein